MLHIILHQYILHRGGSSAGYQLRQQPSWPAVPPVQWLLQAVRGRMAADWFAKISWGTGQVGM